MTLTEFLAKFSTGAFLDTMTPAEILAFTLHMSGLAILLPAIAIIFGSMLWWQIRTLTHPGFRLSTALRSPVPMDVAKAQIARVKTGRTWRIFKYSGSIGLLVIFVGSFVLLFLTDGEY